MLPTDFQIERYIERTTQKNFPFIQKVLTAYLKAMLKNGGNVADLITRIESFVDPFQALFIFNELSPRALKYNGWKYLPVFAYSVERKDINLIKLICSIARLGGAEERYGANLAKSVVTMTDNPADSLTDKGLTTDMQGDSFPVFVIYLDYQPYGLYGVESLSGAWEKLLEVADLITLTKPARVNIVPLYRHNMFYTPNIYQAMYYIIEGQQPLYHNPEAIQYIESLSPAGLQNLYTTAYTEPSEDVELTVNSVGLYVREIYCYSTQKVEKLVVRSNDPNLLDIEANLNWSNDSLEEAVQASLGRYIFKFTIDLRQLYYSY